MIDFSVYLNHTIGFFVFYSYLVFVKWFFMTFMLVSKMTFFFTPYLFFRLHKLAVRIGTMDAVARGHAGKFLNYTRSKLIILEDFVDSDDLFRYPCYTPNSTDFFLFKKVRFGLKRVKPNLYNHDFLDS